MPTHSHAYLPLSVCDCAPSVHCCSLCRRVAATAGLQAHERLGRPTMIPARLTKVPPIDLPLNRNSVCTGGCHYCWAMGCPELCAVTRVHAHTHAHTHCTHHCVHTQLTVCACASCRRLPPLGCTRAPRPVHHPRTAHQSAPRYHQPIHGRIVPFQAAPGRLQSFRARFISCRARAVRQAVWNELTAALAGSKVSRSDAY